MEGILMDGAVSIIMAFAIAWVTTQRKLTSVDERIISTTKVSDSNREQIIQLKRDHSITSMDVSYIKAVNKRLEEDGVENRKVLSALNTTLGNLNVTLGRFDERIKGVEKDVANK